jgi:hypothetical protein
MTKAELRYGMPLIGTPLIFINLPGELFLLKPLVKIRI